MAACLVESNCDILCDFGSCVSQMSSSESMILTDVNKFQTTQVIWQAGTCFVQLKTDVSTLHIHFCLIGLCIEFIKLYLSPYL